MTHIAESPSSALDHEQTQPDERAVRLQHVCGPFVHLPGDPAYDEGRRPWNVAVSQLPVAVAEPDTVEQISRLVRAAADLGLRVSAQTTGHAAGVLAGHRLDDVVLVRTSRLRGVYVDPFNQIARVEGGAVWQDVIDAAAPHGLAAPHGSSGGVGVAGYSLGGGLSWIARKHGLATNSITAVELVAADGEVVRADAITRPDLFWALRGGGGNFGVVTALEIALQPIPDVFAGMLIWDVTHADRVARAWADWCTTAPDEVTTSFRIMRFPPIPHLPDFLRGRSLVVLDGVALLDDAEAADVLAPLRSLDPEMDTFARVPAASLGELHMDPHDPTPGVGAGTLMADLGPDALDTFLAAVGPGADTDLFLAELRQLGGALGREHPGGGALSRLEGSHLAFFVQIAMTPELAAAGRATTEGVVERLSPWASGRNFLNLAERPVDPSTAYDAAAWERLCEVRAEVDPHGVFLANHAIPHNA
jgi:FAD/FMN-containing dehydrogenase